MNTVATASFRIYISEYKKHILAVIINTKHEHNLILAIVITIKKIIGIYSKFSDE